MLFKEIKELLNKRAGIAPEFISSSQFEKLIKQRIEALSYSSEGAYVEYLKHSDEEIQSLINEAVIPETWFFRDKEPFNMFAGYVGSIVEKSTPVRILSVPCSTGEEPYSLAMALFDFGMHDDNFYIDAVDINTRSIESAKQGVYGRNSFRGDGLGFKERYFNEKDSTYHLVQKVCSAVNFISGNVLEKEFLKNRACYQVIFCRNLLIYFNADLKRQVIERLYNLLKPGGLLFLGHSETGQMLDGFFTHLRHPGAFAYKKNRETGEASGAAFYSTSNVVEKRDVFKTSKKIGYKPPSNIDVKNGVSLDNLKDFKKNSLEVIRSMADRGELDAAIIECNQYIISRSDSPEAHYLLGTVYLASNQDKKAFDSFRKVLYLNQKHYQALVHLSAMCEKNGDMVSAKRYRDRIDRLSSLQME